MKSIPLLRPAQRGRQWLKYYVFGLLLVGLQISPLATAASSQTIAQSYGASSNKNLVSGAIVSATKDDGKKVEPATTKSAERLVGVVDKSPLLTISNGSKQVRVVLSGVTSVLVSDINGPIKSGDKIAPSPIAGVGMRATNDSQVVGTAQIAFDTKKAQVRTIKDTAGEEHDVHVGYVALQVATSAYQAPGSSFLPPFVQRIANGIAGRPVSIVRVMACSLLLLISFVGITVLIYTATRSAMISLGRNPLASGTIMRSLYKTIFIAAVATVAVLVGAYVILIV